MTLTTIVVPCHNESRRLKCAEFRQFVAQNSAVSFLFVNDGSTDGTADVLAKLVASNPNRFSLLDLAKNSGKAEAVRQGVQHVTNSQANYIGYWDADLATPLDAVPTFIATLDRLPNIAIVVGTRLRLAGHEIHRRPLRRLLGVLFSRVTGFVLGQRLHDTQCGAKLFRNSPEIQTAFAQPFGSRWIFDVELIARLMKLTPMSAGSPKNWIYELPLDFWEDVAGSKLRRGDFVKAIGELASIWWRYLRPGAPAIALPEEIGDEAGESRRAA
jgi:dolichyl-phosphate beta-glucosyltransferase